MAPRNINPEFTEDYIQKLEFDNKEIDVQLEFLKSADYVEKRIAQIVEYREKIRLLKNKFRN